MAYDFSMIPETYELVREEYIPDIESAGALLLHKKTGARVALLSNTDENKVFSIAFRTPPEDSTGVAHITEHSVLCGSREFPAKDPFVELVKGSLNTFLNAMTYPDKTVYPVASCNDKDFDNLLHIYLDAVFYPNIYQYKEIFLQEGWHYEMEDENSPLTINGVVYNEMKGAFSSPEDVLFRKISNSLYPDTSYGVESGGDPDVIPELSYEGFIAFHKKYYHPSNSFIYLYGDMDFAQKLDFIDRHYLSAFEAAPFDSTVPLQKAFADPVSFEDVYPADSEDTGTYLACSWVTGENGDVRKYIAFQILEYLLMEAPGAPLKEALQKRQFGEDIFGTFESSLRQPYMSIVAKGIQIEDKEKILDVIREELEKLADGALSSRSLEGAVNAMEFKAREADFGRYPKGLMYGLQMLDGWLYDEYQPFDYLKYQEAFDFFRDNLETGYFNQLIREYMLDNPHSSVLMLVPQEGLALKREEEKTARLAAIKESLSAEEVDNILDTCRQLKAWQEAETPREILEKIPLLSIRDIRQNAQPLFNTEIVMDGFQIVHHDIETNGIAYINLLFDCSHISAQEVPYLAILAEILGEIDTQDHTYQELTDEINLYTGGIRTSTLVLQKDDAHNYKAYFSVSGRALYANLEKLFAIFESVIRRSVYSDTGRLKEILGQVKSRQEMTLMGSGHAAAVLRATSYYSEGAWFRELSEGIAFYQFLSELMSSYEEKKDSLAASLMELAGKVFAKDRLIVSYTCDQEGLEAGKGMLASLADSLSCAQGEAGKKPERVNVGLCPYRKEAFTTPGTVQYNCTAGSFADAGFAFSGAMNVMRNILSNEYLWTQVRMLGGAYGCMCAFTTSGDGYFTSYRDPKLARTFDVYRSAAEFLRSFDPDEREMRKFMIGAFGSADAPLTPSMKGARSMSAWLTGRSYEEIQKIRQQMLDTTAEDIRSFADAVEAVARSGNICVIGSESAITAAAKEDPDMFDSVRPLLMQ